jgi:1,4-dihydroxy-2-naphthoate octaprenyltransferase
MYDRDIRRHRFTAMLLLATSIAGAIWDACMHNWLVVLLALFAAWNAWQWLSILRALQALRDNRRLLEAAMYERRHQR